MTKFFDIRRAMERFFLLSEPTNKRLWNEIFKVLKVQKRIVSAEIRYEQKILKVPGSFRFFLFSVFFIIIFVISGKGSLQVNWRFFARRSRLIEVRLNQAFGLFSLFGFSPSRASWFRYVFFFLFGNFVGILFIL